MRNSPNHLSDLAVSTIIAAYNAAPWIEETVESVLRQSLPSAEIIIIDDGSSDDTRARVAGFGDAVQYVHQANRGSAAARNRGIRLAKSKYVAFLDHDDTWEPEKLERQMGAMTSRDPATSPDPAAWSYTAATPFDSTTGASALRASPRTGRHEGDVLRPLLLGNFIPFSTVIADRNVFEEAGYFDETGTLRDLDWHMWLRIAARHPVRYVDQPLTNYRIHPNQMSHTANLDETLRSRLAVIDFVVESWPERVGDIRPAAAANAYFTIGRKWLNREDRPRAREAIGSAIRLRPSHAPYLAYWLATLVPRPLLQLLGHARRLAEKSEASRRPSAGHE